MLTLVIGAAKMPNLTTPRRTSFDTTSLLLSAIGFGVLGIAAFVLRQLRLQRRDTAVFDLRIFTYPAFTRPVITFVFLVVGAFALSTLLPLVLPESLGLGSLETGLLVP